MERTCFFCEEKTGSGLILWGELLCASCEKEFSSPSFSDHNYEKTVERVKDLLTLQALGKRQKEGNHE